MSELTADEDGPLRVTHAFVIKTTISVPAFGGYSY